MRTIQDHRAYARPSQSPPPGVDAHGLERMLRNRVRGEVRFDDGARALYSTDASNYRQIPIGVVVPRDSDDVVAAVEACRLHGAPVVSRGGGTSLAGQACNVAVVLDFSKYMNRVLSVDADRRVAVVQPGVVLDRLREAGRPHGLTFGPDPATHDRCTLGGMIGNNSCGIHSQMSGRTSDYVEELEVLTYQGERFRVGPASPQELQQVLRAGGARADLYRRLVAFGQDQADLIRRTFPPMLRRSSGYALEYLLPENGPHLARALVGSEGTCAIILEATVRLVPDRRERVLVVAGYPDVGAAGDDVPRVAAAEPVGLEGVDQRLADYVRKRGVLAEALPLLPAGNAWLLIEFGADAKADAREQAESLAGELERSLGPGRVAVYDDALVQQKLWDVRESGLGATARVPGERDTWEGWEDSAVPPERLGSYLRGLQALLARYGYEAALYGHFGQGCVHTRIPFDLMSAGGIQAFQSFLREAAQLCVDHGGSLSGEHGDGQARAEFLPLMFGEDGVELLRAFKRAWDPDGGLNPGKVVDAFAVTDNLRMGAGHAPWEPATAFAFTQDANSFARAANRCVGVGLCRRTDSGVMCPSYMVTLEEEHSTRGRARLLYEMMEGDVLRDGWRSDAVREALDLCLSCKGCRRECPVQVDMATYKAEFLHHHYAGRIRPRAAYALGSIDRWARLASYAPRLANGILGAPGLRRLAKWAAGVAPERDLPRFAPRTFRESFTQRAERNPDAPRVLLFPDTFTNHFDPQIAMAAADVLEAAGFRVDIPERILCCGRPLYDFGRLDRARRLLGQVLETLHEDIEAGTPVVGLEPSCVAVFRDEMTHLLPNDHDARRLRDQVYTLGEFLTAHDVAPPLRPRLAAALVQRHCHHQAVMGFELDEAALARTGTDYTLLDSGCCGMAGAFGFERGHYDVSVAIAERRLLPAIRQAPPGTTLVADGFSCRTQIQQLTGQRAFHLAEVLQQCLAEPEPRTPTPGAARPLDRQRARHRWRERETAWARPPSPP